MSLFKFLLQWLLRRLSTVLFATKLFVQGSRVSNVTDVCVGIIEHVSYVSMLLLFLIFQVTTYLLIKHFYLRIFFLFHRNNAGRVPSRLQGYTYNQHRQRGIITDWQCTVWPKMNPCQATVRQRSCDDFQTGSNLHNHQPQVGASTVAKITAKVKAMAVEDVFRPALAIVDEVSNTS